MIKRKLPVLLPALALLALAPAARAQEEVSGPPQRRALQDPDLQAQINDVFGVLLQYAAAIPFKNVAGWLGLDTPQRLVDATGQPRYQRVLMRGHEGPVHTAMLSPDGARLLTLGDDRTARLWNVRPRDVHAPDDTREGVQLLEIGADAALTAAAFFPDGEEITLGSADGTARVFALKSTANGSAVEATEVLRLDGHEGAVRHVAYSPDGTTLLTIDAGGRARRFDRAGALIGEPVALTGHSGDIVRVQCANDGMLLTAAEGDANARLWNSSWTPGAVLELADAAAAAEAEFVDRDGATVVRTPAADNQITYFDTNGTPLTTEASDPPAFTATLEGNDIALQGADGQALTLSGHDAPITQMFFGADHTRLISASADGSATVWEWLVRDPTGALVITNVPLVVIWLVVAAIVFTIYMRFVNVRLFGHAIAVVRGKYDDPDDEGEVSHFQALSSALSGTVGLGNIAGVAIAIMVGGPGATVWMIVAGLLGMTLKFTECTLGQRYRKVDEDGHVSGGPMHYLKEGLDKRGLGFIGAPLAVIFTLFCIGGSLAGGNSFQVNQSLTILAERVPYFKDNGWVYGAIMAVFVGIVIIGGIRRIAQTAERIVPTMCGLYLVASLTIIVFNIEHVPGAFAAIFGGAFTGEAMYGGALGALIMGFRRAAFSNEAGVGSASIAHSAARTPYPVREGIVALLEPFIDTVVVCTMTALVINITEVHKMPEHAHLVASTQGAALTSEAFQTVSFLAGWFPWVLMGAVILFAFSTMITWSYYGERCWTHLFGTRSSMAYKLLFLLFVVLGSVIQATNILEFGDLMILLMAFPNIAGLYFLGSEVKGELREYEAKLHGNQLKTYK